MQAASSLNSWRCPGSLYLIGDVLSADMMKNNKKYGLLNLRLDAHQWDVYKEVELELPVTVVC